MSGKSIWCGDSPPRHRECPGYHQVNNDNSCDCSCGHPHLDRCICGRVHRAGDDVATIPDMGDATWCVNGKHDQCPGHQRRRPDFACECECGHPNKMKTAPTEPQPIVGECICGEYHSESEKAGTITGGGASMWCLNKDHEGCPGHQQGGNSGYLCECGCGHKHLEKRMPKVPAIPEVKDMLPAEVSKLVEDPQQFEWWLSSRPSKDLSIEYGYTGNTMLNLMHQYMVERLSDPDRVEQVLMHKGRPTTFLKHPIRKNGDLVSVPWPEWSYDLLVRCDPNYSGSVPYWKVHKAVVAWQESWNSRDKEDE